MRVEDKRGKQRERPNEKYKKRRQKGNNSGEDKRVPQGEERSRKYRRKGQTENTRGEDSIGGQEEKARVRDKRRRQAGRIRGEDRGQERRRRENKRGGKTGPDAMYENLCLIVVFSGINNCSNNRTVQRRG
jgi:hypothetical protein